MIIANCAISLIAGFFVLLITNAMFGKKAGNGRMAAFVILYWILGGVSLYIIAKYNYDFIKPVSSAVITVVLVWLVLKQKIWRAIIIYCMMALFSGLGSSIIFIFMYNSVETPLKYLSKTDLPLFIMFNIML